MITEKELLISNKSYIGKDFSTIYAEEIDLIKKMTNRYDPETSNESDPGIVLTKTNAFVGDKLCYNIDKNALENYMPSATQESSMRDLCGRLGYEMKYYNASATEIYIKYTGNLFADYPDAFYFDIPRFTEISSQDGSVTFTTVTGSHYGRNEDYVNIDALQGVIHELTVADSNAIQLENLNSQNRIYFNESIVAENGVFVRNIDSSDDWKKTDNLNLELPNTKCFKFGYDSSLGWPYIEFPEDVASLIGNGLHVDYIVTQGENGNVNANFLNKISNSEGFYFYNNNGQPITNSSGEQISVNLTEDNPELIVKNISSSIGGSNPETIDSAYNNFKRTIGTFDTLVTCRDYANAIYNLYDSDNVYPVVSNIQVADRRDDINYSNKILSLDEYGSCYLYGNTGITAYDLCLYPLNPITSYTADNYIESFRPKLSTSYIKESIEDNKSISHDYKQIGTEDIYAIINKYKLDVKLTTTYKVNNYERLSIIANVLNAIIKNFNAREVDYGEEIPYDTLLSVIQNADERINYVSMAEPVPVTHFMRYDGKEININSQDGRTYYLNLLARNILAGKISLFDLYNAFSFGFNETSGNVKNELAKIETHANITLSNGDEYPLLENEAIQVVGPSFVTVVSYSYGIRYQYQGTSTITKDSEYMLRTGESLTVNYKPSDSTDRVTKVYGVGEIIKPNFDLQPSNNYAMIQSDQQIDIRKLNESKLTGYTYCYWLRNKHLADRSNVLFVPDDAIVIDGNTYYRVMLQDGEYFFYKNSLKDDFISLGSGTILTIPESTFTSVSWSVDIVSIDDILENGSDAIKWKYLAFNQTNSFDIQETSILTLTSNDKIKLIDNSNESGAFNEITLDNDLQPLQDTVNIKYTIADGTEQSLGSINYDSSDDAYKWKIKSRLDINAGPNLSQSIDGNGSTSKHKVIFTFKDGTTLPETSGQFYGDAGLSGFSFNLNANQQFVGSSNVDATSYDITANEGDRIKYPLSVYVCKHPENIDNVEYFRNALGFINVVVNNDGFNYVGEISTPFNSEMNLPLQKDSLLTIYYKKNDSTDDAPVIQVYDKYSPIESGDSPIAGIMWYNEDTEYQYGRELKSGINVFKLSSNVKSLKITKESGIDGVMSIGELTYLNTTEDNLEGFNPVLKLNQGEGSILLSKISAIDSEHKFFYNNKVTADNLIDTDDMSSPYAFYDYNNIANKFVLSKIDISADGGSVIDVVKTSLK